MENDPCWPPPLPGYGIFHKYFFFEPFPKSSIFGSSEAHSYCNEIDDEALFLSFKHKQLIVCIVQQPLGSNFNRFLTAGEPF